MASRQTRSARKRWPRIALAAVAAVALALAATHLWLGQRRLSGWDPAAFRAAATEWRAEIVRDRWGVPHVYGRSDADTAFGLAWAHAEDDVESFETLLPLYRAEQGLERGPGALPGDYLVQLLEIPEAVAAGHPDLEPATRRLLDAYAAGLNAFAAEHPQRVTRHLYPVGSHDLLAAFSLQHLFFYGFQDHLRRLVESDDEPPELLRDVGAIFGLDTPTGSNAIAVAPSRSADGATRVVLNSHQPLRGPVAWYEAHLVSREGLDVHGGLFPGMPVIAVGTTPTTAWSATVNKPDLVDVYRLELDPDDARRYRLDGGWAELETRPARLASRLLGNLRWTFRRDLSRSIHGPVLVTDEGAFALRFAGHREVHQIEQWYAMNRARDLDTWKRAMRRRAVASLNFVYGDADGNIYFLHNAASPERSPGVDWTGELPGDRSELVWSETVPFERLPQVENPVSGYLLSANQTPFRVSAPADDPDPAAYPPELGLQAEMTNRAHRGLELLAADTEITREELDAIKLDIVYSPASAGWAYLRAALDHHYAEPRHAAAQAALARWDRAAALDSNEAALGVCVLTQQWVAEQRAEPPAQAPEVLAACADRLVAAFGTVEVPWGEVNRLVRGAESWPLAGGPDTLRAVYGRDPDGDGVLEAAAGDGLYLVVEWDRHGRRTVRSIHPFGAATSRPGSPHYADQAPLFASGRMKAVELDEARVRSQAESVESVPPWAAASPP